MLPFFNIISEIQALLLVLIIIYFIDCFIWVHRNSVSLITLYGAGKYFIPSAITFGSQRGYFVFVNPLPPLGNVFVSHPWPVSFSTQAVCSFVSQKLIDTDRPSQDCKIFHYNEIDTVEAESNDIYINGKEFATCRSSKIADRVARFIKKNLELAVEDREKLIYTTFDQMLDEEGIKKRTKDFRRKSLVLKIFCNILFIDMFIWIPFVIWKFGLVRYILPLIFLWLFLHLLVLIMYYRVHGLLYPSDKKDRIKNLLIMLVSPPEAVRACDNLSFRVLEAYHPLAVVSVLASGNNFKSFVKKIILDLRYPVKTHDLSEEIIAVDKCFRSILDNIYISFLKKKGLDVKTIVERRLSGDSSCLSFCPRCHCEYTIPSGECRDCYGVRLVPIARGV